MQKYISAEVTNKQVDDRILFLRRRNDLIKDGITSTRKFSMDTNTDVSEERDSRSKILVRKEDDDLVDGVAQLDNERDDTLDITRNTDDIDFDKVKTDINNIIEASIQRQVQFTDDGKQTDDKSKEDDVFTQEDKSSEKVSKIVLDLFMASRKISLLCSDKSRPNCDVKSHWGDFSNVRRWCHSLCPYGYCPDYICSCECPVKTTPVPTTTTTIITTTRPVVCHGLSVWGDQNEVLNKWCSDNCAMNYCPGLLCVCD